jgi:hypothetical protein
MVLTDVTFNGSDWGVLGALAVFVLLGLLFGATKTGLKIVNYVLSGFLSVFIANIILPYLIPMEWYQKIVTTFGGNDAAVNWLATILLTCVSFGVVFLILSLLAKIFVAALSQGKVITRLVGMIIGALDWFILLLAVSFLFAALPRWLGTNTPDWITQANNYLTSSTILGKLMELYNAILSALHLA